MYFFSFWLSKNKMEMHEQQCKVNGMSVCKQLIHNNFCWWIWNIFPESACIFSAFRITFFPKSACIFASRPCPKYRHLDSPHPLRPQKLPNWVIDPKNMRNVLKSMKKTIFRFWFFEKLSFLYSNFVQIFANLILKRLTMLPSNQLAMGIQCKSVRGLGVEPLVWGANNRSSRYRSDLRLWGKSAHVCECVILRFL